VNPSIVLPFLATVRLVIFQLYLSSIIIVSPSDGVAGSVMVNVPPLVSASMYSNALAV
jgi:hypothetical protein